MQFELQIRKIHNDKKRYIDLLLMGDEEEKMIDLYLERGDMYVAFISEVAVGVCVVTKETEIKVEIKNIAVLSGYRRKGIGRELLGFIEHEYAGNVIQLGTGETPSTLGFYTSSGYEFSHRISDFFTEHYSHPIIEEGITLKDMVYLVKKTAGSRTSKE